MTTTATLNDNSGTLMHSGKSPFLKQLTMTSGGESTQTQQQSSLLTKLVQGSASVHKKKKMSISQQGPYRAGGYVAPSVSLANQGQPPPPNSIFNSKKHIVSMAGDQFVIQSHEYQQKQLTNESNFPKQSSSHQASLQNAVVRFENSGSRANLG